MTRDTESYLYTLKENNWSKLFINFYEFGILVMGFKLDNTFKIIKNCMSRMSRGMYTVQALTVYGSQATF